MKVGRCLVTDYDAVWLDVALRRAAVAAEQADFPYVVEIRTSVMQYLETHCSLRLLALEDLFERVRKMLVQIGCAPIARRLVPLAPPVTISLRRVAQEAGNGFELAFYEMLRSDLADLRSHGAEQIRFIHFREAILILRNTQKWDKRCDLLLEETHAFIHSVDYNLQTLEADFA